MKAIILAAEGGQNDSNQPRCFTKISQNTTVLERQFRLLNLIGLRNDQIIVVIGSKGVWSDVSQSNLESKNRFCIRVNDENSCTNSAHSLRIGLSGIKDEDVLIIHGDLFFDICHLEKMMQVRDKASILTRQSIFVGETGFKLEADESNTVINFGTEIFSKYPWFLYCGMVHLQSGDVRNFKDRQTEIEAGSAIEALLKAICLSRFMVIDYSTPKSGSKGAGSNSIDLIGGSFANLSKRLLVRKQADENGRKKLISEILWLQNLSPKIASVFPKVIDCDIVSNQVWFDMPWYDVPSLRKKILLGDVDVQVVCKNIGTVMDFVFQNLYTERVGSTPENWVLQSHIRRVFDRLVAINKSSSMMSKLISSETVCINGQEYENLTTLFFKITQLHKLLKTVEPTEMRLIHGDLHFQNILFGPNEEGTDFILADPRGEINGSDIYYDLGKLWHSFNGLYDCIHTDQFDLSIDFSNDGKSVSSEILFYNPQWVNKYKAIGSFIENKVLDYPEIKSDKNWRLKVLFAEAMHFSSVMIFHLKDTPDEKRASAMYLTAVRLINELYEEFELHKLPVSRSVLGFSSIQEYLLNFKN